MNLAGHWPATEPGRRRPAWTALHDGIHHPGAQKAASGDKQTFVTERDDGSVIAPAMRQNS